MKVAITGSLERMERKEAANLINTKTNAEFAKSVTYDTNYLVAGRFDTAKAKKAVKIGVAVISEDELLEFIEAGEFPHIAAPERPHREWHGDTLDWADLPQERTVLLDYADADGVVTERRLVTLIKSATGSGGQEYLGGMFGNSFRTFRVDRILTMSDV